MIDVSRSPESVHFAMSSYFDLKSIWYAEKRFALTFGSVVYYNLFSGIFAFDFDSRRRYYAESVELLATSVRFAMR